MTRFEEVRAEALSATADLGVTGAALGVVADVDEEVACIGVTSLENPLPVTPETLFQIGSIGKTYTAAAVMRLVERGEVDLDAPVRTYLPEFRVSDEAASAGATMRHLLTHTGGWLGDYFDDLGRGDEALTRMVERLADVPQLTPLGEVWSYNNSGFYVAGRMIEAVTGRTFETALRDLVLEPLALERSFFFPDEVLTYRFAVGHVLADHEEPAVAREWWIGRAAHPCGGIVQSIRDLVRYARFAFDGRPLLSTESWAEMQRPQAPVGGDVDAVGLAWMLRELEGVRLLSHGGGTRGQASLLCVAPEERFAFAMLTNHEHGGAAIDRVAKVALEAYLEVRDREPQPRELEAGALEEYAGRYTSRMADAELAVVDGGLELRLTPKGGFPRPDTPASPPPPPIPVAFYDDDWLVATEGIFKGARAGFLRGPDGRIAWFRLGGRVYAPE